MDFGGAEKGRLIWSARGCCSMVSGGSRIGALWQSLRALKL